MKKLVEWVINWGAERFGDSLPEDLFTGAILGACIGVVVGAILVGVVLLFV